MMWSDYVELACPTCGVGFGLPRALYDQRCKDHRSFQCPNGHSQWFSGKTKQEKEIEQLKRQLRRWMDAHNDVWAGREELLGAFKECPIDSCHWRSRKQIPRDQVAMGRGIERVRHDLLEHLVRDHSSRVSASPPLLGAGDSS